MNVRVWKRKSKVDHAALDTVKRDHPYIGGVIEFNLLKIKVSQDFANSNRVLRKHVEIAVRRLNNIRPFVLLSGRNTLTVDIGEVTGQARCMKTGQKDFASIFYAPRRDVEGKLVLDQMGSPIYRRYVITNEKEETTLLTLVMDFNPRETVLVTGYPGEKSRKMPGLGANLRDCLWWFNPETGRGHAFRADPTEKYCEDLAIWPSCVGEIPWQYPEK